MLILRGAEDLRKLITNRQPQPRSTLIVFNPILQVSLIEIIENSETPIRWDTYPSILAGNFNREGFCIEYLCFKCDRSVIREFQRIAK